MPTLGYTFYVSNNATGAAAEMNANIRMTVRSVAQIASSTVPSTFLADETSFLEPWFQFDEEHNLTEIPFSGIMTPLIEDYMVHMYSIQGFFHSTSRMLLFEVMLIESPLAFQGYQANNRNETYEFDIAQGNFTLTQPTFAVYPTKDPVADWAAFATQLGSANFLSNFYNAVCCPYCRIGLYY